MDGPQTFRTLLLSLPTGNAALRMRLWRTLRNTGCGVLRDGVYILPQRTPQATGLDGIASEVRSAGGFALTADLAIDGSAEIAHIRTLFDRSRDYAALVADLRRETPRLRRIGQRKAESVLQRLGRSCERLAAIDFYPGEAQRQARDALAALEREVRALFTQGEPHAATTRPGRVDPARYRARTWATRKKPWIDRLASAWLIRRFIDEKAKFVWIESARDCPKHAIGFDFDGAQFTHADNRVTFEVLLASFGLTDDPALVSIGAAVHFLDVGGIPVADARGLETLLTGIREKTRSDDAMLREATRILDLLYAAYSQREDNEVAPSVMSR